MKFEKTYNKHSEKNKDNDFVTNNIKDDYNVYNREDIKINQNMSYYS